MNPHNSAGEQHEHQGDAAQVAPVAPLAPSEDPRAVTAAQSRTTPAKQMAANNNDAREQLGHSVSRPAAPNVENDEAAKEAAAPAPKPKKAAPKHAEKKAAKKVVKKAAHKK